jgi:hypothetical protein
MPRPYSYDLRTHVIEEVAAGPPHDPTRPVALGSAHVW